MIDEKIKVKYIEVIMRMLEMGMTREEIERELMKSIIKKVDEMNISKNEKVIKEYKKKYGLE